MKAKLLVVINGEDNVELNLNIIDKRFYPILTLPLDGEKKDFLNKLEEILNEASIIINSIPGIKLEISGSVYEFIEDDDDEEVRKLINQLLIEI